MTIEVALTSLSVTSATPPGTNTQTQGWYDVNFSWLGTDTVNNTQASGSNNSVQIPFNAPKKMDDLIRAAIASNVLSITTTLGQTGMPWTIDPDDIYVPFSG